MGGNRRLQRMVWKKDRHRASDGGPRCNYVTGADKYAILVVTRGCQGHWAQFC